MKKILLLLFLFSFTKTYAQVPNSGFENWSPVYYGQKLDGWRTNIGDFSPIIVMPDSGAYAGSLCMKMIGFSHLESEAITFFPIATHPAALEAWVKGPVKAGDSVTIVARVYNHGAMVDSGRWVNKTGITNWTKIHIPITQDATTFDSCYIRIMGGSDVATELMVDEMAFAAGNGIDKIRASADYSVYPSPARDWLYIQPNELNNIQAEITVLDAAGRSLHTETVKPTGGSYMLSTASLSAGLYLLQIKQSDSVATLRFVKQL